MCSSHLQIPKFELLCRRFESDFILFNSCTWRFFKGFESFKRRFESVAFDSFFSSLEIRIYLMEIRIHYIGIQIHLFKQTYLTLFRIQIRIHSFEIRIMVLRQTYWNLDSNSLNRDLNLFFLEFLVYTFLELGFESSFKGFKSTSAFWLVLFLFD